MSGQLSWPEDPKDAKPSGDRPRQIRIAEILSYVGAAVSTVLAVSAFLAYRGISQTPLAERQQRAREVLQEAKRPAKAEDIAKYLDGLVQAYISIGVVLALAVILWIVMGQFITRGKAWTRMVSTGLAVVNLLFVIASGQAYTIIGMASMVLGLAVAALLWTRPARAWFGLTNVRV
jgi:hypothetical protein